MSKLDTTTEPEAVPETADVSDVIRTGNNKVEPTTTQRTTPPKRRGGLGVFGQVAEAIAKSLAGGHAALPYRPQPGVPMKGQQRSRRGLRTVTSYLTRTTVDLDSEQKTRGRQWASHAEPG